MGDGVWADTGRPFSPRPAGGHAWTAQPPAVRPRPQGIAIPTPAAMEPSASQPPPSPRQRTSQARLQTWAKRYQHVRELLASAVVAPDRPDDRPAGQERDSLPAVETVSGFDPGPTEADPAGPFGSTTRSWTEEGGRAAEFHRELAGRGCGALFDAVRRYLARYLGGTGRPGPPVGALKLPAPRLRRISRCSASSAGQPSGRRTSGGIQTGSKPVLWSS